MSIVAYRLTKHGRLRGEPSLTMRTTTYLGMMRWIWKSEKRRRYYRKLMWIEAEGEPAHTLVPPNPRPKRARYNLPDRG